MLVQFSIWPLDSPHMSRDVAAVAAILEETGVTYEIGPMGTVIEGEWEEVLTAVKVCQQRIREKHQRVLTSITIDDDATRPQSLHAAKDKAQAIS